MLQLPVSTMDIRKVQNIVKEIYSGGKIKVSITEDLDQLDNKDKVLVIGSNKTIKYVFQTLSEMMINYFNIMEESNFQILDLINKYTINSDQYFPIYGFSSINTHIEKSEILKTQQKLKLDDIMNRMHDTCKVKHNNISEIENDNSISKSYKFNAIIYSIMKSNLDLYEIESYLKAFAENKSTDYRRLLCAYDYMKYSS